MARPWNNIDKNASLRAKHDNTLSRLYEKDDRVDKAIVDVAEEVAKARQLPMSVISSAWCLHKGVNPIVGLNSKERIDEAVLAAKTVLSDEEITKLEAHYQPKNIMGY